MSKTSDNIKGMLEIGREITGDTKRQSTLTDWKIVDMGQYYRLTWKVMDDYRYHDNEPVVTSVLERIDFVSGVAETKNTVYRLR